MKITARISAAMSQLKTSAAHKLGKAFGRTARVVDSPLPTRPQSREVLPFPVLKRPKTDVDVIKNMSVNFEHDDYEVLQHGKIVAYLVNATHDDVTMKYPNPVELEQLSCRHMVVEELTRRESEKVHPHIHTKADRAEVFDVKHTSFMAAQRQRLERRLHDITLYSDNIHIFKNEKMGMFLEAEFRKLKVGEVKNFLFLSPTHAMTLTLKHKKEGYSVSLWDPNRTADHIKMKFSAPGQTTNIKVETFLGPHDTARYTRMGTDFKAVELPKGWVKDATKRTPAINEHYYKLGPVAHDATSRAQWVKAFPGTNI